MTAIARRRAAAVAVVLLVAAGCGGDDGNDEGAPAPVEDGAADGGGAGEPVATDAVEIVDFTFAPADVTVEAGTTVTWTNGDEAIHSVADDALGFESEDLAEGGSFSFTYDEAGEFPYICGIHDYMEGTVTVS